MSAVAIHSGEFSRLQATPAEPSRCAGAVFLALACLVVMVAFVVPIQDHWISSTFEDYVDTENLETGTRDGSMARRLAFGSMGLLGLAALAWPGGKQFRLGQILPLLCAAYVTWCAASYLWAEEPDLAFRRLVVYFCAIAAALGFAKRASPRQYIGILFTCTAVWIGLGVAAELSLGTFRPWQSGYRFAGIFHPNSSAVCAAILALSSIYLAMGARRGRRLLFVGAAAVAIAVLILTRSRTAVAGSILALAALWFVIAPLPRICLRALVAAAAVACVMIAVGLGIFSFSTDIFSMGREDHDLSSLTGRVPLWLDLLEIAEQRPWTGFGYGSFWTTDRIAEISDRYYAPISIAHSAYLDFVLDIGLIGAALCVSAMALAFVEARRREIQSPKLGYGFIAMLVGYGLSIGLLESSLNVLWFLSFFGICGVSFLMFRDDPPAPATSASPEIVKVGNIASFNSLVNSGRTCKA